MSRIADVILPSTTKTEWSALRANILERFLASMGDRPTQGGGVTRYEEVGRFEQDGITHVRVRYHVIDEEWNEGIFLLPKNLPAPGILVQHGTTGASHGPDAQGMLVTFHPGFPARSYALDLVRRGYVTFSVDQLGFGTNRIGESEEETIRRFYENYPNWSVDGRRLLEHQRAIDVMQAIGFARPERFGTMGISLGGRGVVYLMATDERIAAGVAAAGISPNFTNLFRSLGRQRYLSPALSEAMEVAGHMPWEYQEVLSLCAPRAFFGIEPFNDARGCNPDVWPTMECLYQASKVYTLLGKPEALSFLVHGDGHDTPADIRENAYKWFDRFLT